MYKQFRELKFESDDRDATVTELVIGKKKKNIIFTKPEIMLPIYNV